MVRERFTASGSIRRLKDSKK